MTDGSIFITDGSVSKTVATRKCKYLGVISNSEHVSHIVFKRDLLSDLFVVLSAKSFDEALS